MHQVVFSLEDIETLCKFLTNNLIRAAHLDAKGECPSPPR